MQGIFRKENTDKALKYGIYRHLPTYEKIIRNLVSFYIKKVRLESDPKKIPVMGVMGAFVFAAQMINFTIPGTGSSGHLCGGMMLTALLGPYAAFLTMIGVLLIQCLLFADGGLLALGCNIWNMAFYGAFSVISCSGVR